MARKRLSSKRWPSWQERTLLLAILLAPSLWMLLTVPPFWKDVDAYAQVTAPPNLITIVHYGPLYCFSARIPLYLGYAAHCLRIGQALPSLHFFAEPTLSDAGVQTLLWSQHLGLCFATLFVLCGIPGNRVTRVALAAFWAANPLFYSFAQCVGSETLSLIILLLIAGAVVRIFFQPDGLTLWIILGLLMTLSMLTRHVNGVVAALLPLGFGFAAFVRFIGSIRCKPGRARGWLAHLGRKDLLRGGLAISLGIASIVLNQLTFRVVCHALAIPYQTRVGFSFLFRLDYFAPLTPAQREPLLARAADHSRMPEVQTMLEALRQLPTTKDKFDVGKFWQGAQANLPVDIGGSMEKSDTVLNETARAFLIAPSGVYLRAVEKDCIDALTTTVSGVIYQLVVSTDFYFTVPDSMPQFTKLTIVDQAKRQARDRFLERKFVRFWRRYTYRRLLCVAAALLAFVAFVRRTGKPEMIGSSIALIMVGMLSILGNNIVNEFQARYTMPGWAFTFVAASLLVAALPATRSQDRSLQTRKLRKRSAGRLVSQVKLPGRPSPFLRKGA